MKYRYVSVLLLVLILAIGAVSAQDNATDADVISTASDDVISVDSNVNTLQNESGTQEIHLNDANFANYFDENGTMNDNVANDTTIYVGDITNKSMYINKMVTILPENVSNIVDSTFNFIEGSAYSNIKGLTITNDFKLAIYVINAEFVNVWDNTINILGNANYTDMAIMAFNASDISIGNNKIKYNGKNDGYIVTNAIVVMYSNNADIGENIMNITIPSAPVGWEEDPAGSGNWVSSPLTEGIVVSSSDNVTFRKNKVYLEASDKTGDYDTIYVVDFKDSNNTVVEENVIEAIGHSYIYGLIISGQNFNVTANDIFVLSDEYYADGIDVEGPATGVVEENNITIMSPTAAYGIYSAMSNGNVSVSYTGNVINANAFAVYGMELAGNLEFVVNNEITLTGNYTTGIASKSKLVGISRNKINADGSSVGNTSAYWDAFAPNTVGINLYNTSADVYENTIQSEGVGIIIEGGEESIFEDNEIIVNDNGQKDSTAFNANMVNGLNFTNNLIIYTGNTTGSTINSVVNIESCNGTVISLNEFYGNVVSLPAIWTPQPDGSWAQEIVSHGLVFKDCECIEIYDNDISVRYDNHIGDYDNIYALEVSSDNALIENNNITAKGYSYIYGILISGNDFTIAENNINSTSDAYYANGIDVEGPAIGVVDGNTITAEAPTVAYPVYSAMSNGNVTVDYTNNIINALADVVYGMELAGDTEAVTNNTITVNGNFTTAIAAKTKDINIQDNTIIANGTNLGNTTVWEAFPISTMGISLYNSTAFVFNNTIESTSNGVYAEGGEAMFLLNNIRVDDDGNVPSSGIVAIDMESIDLLGNSLWYVGQTNGTNQNVAVLIEQCNNTTIEQNDIYANIVACDVDWSSGVPQVVSSGIVLNDCDGIEVLNNNLTVAFGNHTGNYDTIYAVDVNSNNALIDGNTIKAQGYSYIYALQVSGENFTVSNNDIYALAESYYANGINVEGPASGVVEGNTITAEAPVVSYPVYSSMSGEQVIADYIDNVINGEADIVYGMELAGTNESVQGNTITVKGNKTTGIAGTSDNLVIVDNKIEALGENLGNTTIWEYFAPETTGVKIIGGNATVEKNNITANGAATVNITDVNATVVYNYLVGNETFGDGSVYFEGESAEVHDNLPDFDGFIHTEDIIMYYKNGTRFVAKVTDFYGRPLSDEIVTFLINNMTYNRITDANGTASIAINLDAGNYTILTTLWPVGNFTPSQVTNNITVLTTILGNDLVKMFRNDTQYSATFLDGQGNPLVGVGAIFNINGVMYTRTTDSKGVATLNINLDPGQYIITAVNPNNGEAHANLITVLSPIESSDLVKYYRNESQFVVTIYGKDGKVVGAGENVTFNINGVFYTRTTNESGQAKLNINLQPGNYTITTMYNGCFIGNNVEVLPVLTANDLVMKQGTSDQFIAYLVDGQGKPFEGQTVNFNIHGLFYDRVTDADGRAILNIRLSAVADTYIITSSYNGTSIGNKIIIVP